MHFVGVKVWKMCRKCQNMLNVLRKDFRQDEHLTLEFIISRVTAIPWSSSASCWWLFFILYWDRPHGSTGPGEFAYSPPPPPPPPPPTPPPPPPPPPPHHPTPPPPPPPPTTPTPTTPPTTPPPPHPPPTTPTTPGQNGGKLQNDKFKCDFVNENWLVLHNIYLSLFLMTWFVGR